MIYLFMAAALVGILAGQYADYRRYKRYWSRRGFPDSRNRPSAGDDTNDDGDHYA